MLLPYLFNVSQNTEVLFITVVGILNLTTNTCIIHILPMLNEIRSLTILDVAGGSKRMESTIKNLTSFLVIIQCVLSYVLLAFHITSLYPILYDDLPNLLLPWIYLTFLKQILLKLLSLGIGTFICWHSYGCCFTSICIRFTLYKLFEICLAAYAVRSYILFYKYLKHFYDEFLFDNDNSDYSYLLNVDERVDKYRKKARSIKPFSQKRSIQISLPEGRSYIKITHSLSNTQSSEMFSFLNIGDINDEMINNDNIMNNDDDIYNFDLKLNNFGEDYPLIFNQETLIKEEIYDKNNLMERKKGSNSSSIKSINEFNSDVIEKSDNITVTNDTDELKNDDRPFIIDVKIVQTADSFGSNSVEFAKIYITYKFSN